MKRIRLSKDFTLLVSAGFLVGMILNTPVSAETLRFKADLKEDGSIDLVPIGADESPGSAGSPGKLFMVQDGGGAVKGIYSNHVAALEDQVSVGDTIRVFETTDQVGMMSFPVGLFEVDESKLDEIAKKAAKRLLSAAKESACGFNPLPETVSPSVEVSFSLGIGGSISIQATWRTENICRGQTDG